MSAAKTGKWVKREPQTNTAAVEEANMEEYVNPTTIPTSRA